MFSRIFKTRVDPESNIQRPQPLRRLHSAPTPDETPILITISSETPSAIGKKLSEPMNLGFAPSSLLDALSFPATARGLGSLAVRAFSRKHTRHAAFIAFYPHHTTTIDQSNSTSSLAVDIPKSLPFMEIERVPSVAGSSTSSSRSASPSRRSKKQNNALLLREMRRLRAENEILHGSIAMVQEDLRAERQARRIADECHHRYVTQMMHERDQHEMTAEQYLQDIEDLKNEIAELRLQNQEDSGLSYVGAADKRNIWGCHTIEGDEDMMCHYPTGESAFPDALDRVDWSEEENISREDDLDDEELFENSASSYLQQALTSGLTSARVNLELDDMIIKYDPSPRTILRTVTTTFVTWLGERLQVSEKDQARKIMIDVIQKVFIDYWKVILQQYIRTEHDQLEFLFVAEEHMLQGDVPNRERLAEQYQRLLLILYKYDIVDEEALLSWWRGSTNDAELSQSIRDTAQKFIEWMEHDEEDTDEEDGEDEEDNAKEDTDDKHTDYIDDQESPFGDFDSDDTVGSADQDSLVMDDYSSNTDEDIHNLDYTDSLPEDNLCVCCFDKQSDDHQVNMGGCTSDSNNSTEIITDKAFKAKKSVRIIG